MIVVGVDVHKQSLTAVAVDEVGRSVAELTVGSARSEHHDRMVAVGCADARNASSRPLERCGIVDRNEVEVSAQRSGTGRKRGPQNRAPDVPNEQASMRRFGTRGEETARRPDPVEASGHAEAPK